MPATWKTTATSPPTRYPDDLEQRVRGTWAALDPSGALGAECWPAVARKASAWDAADKGVCDRDRANVLEQLFGYVGSPERSAATLKHWGALTCATGSPCRTFS